MSTFKKCKVVMLPTEKASTLYSTSDPLIPKLFKCSNVEVSNGATGKNQHLYIISDDVIKEDDWLYNLQSKKIRQCFSIEKNRLVYNEYDKKIIATSDNSLAVAIIDIEQYSFDIVYLPQPSQSFIEKYIKQYNKENIITDIMVEYERDEEVTGYEYDTLKVDKDNTITIKRIKDTFGLEEVKKLCKSAFITGSRINDINYFEWEKIIYKFLHLICFWLFYSY